MEVPVSLNIQEIRKPDLDAQLVAANIAVQLERRAMFRRVIKRAAQNTMRQGAQGVKVRVAGRLGAQKLQEPSGIKRRVLFILLGQI